MEVFIWFLSTSSLKNVTFLFFSSVFSQCFIIIREQETIDVERKLRYEFMCKRCQKEMPEERKYNSYLINSLFIRNKF